MSRKQRIKVDYMARVEGEAALDVTVENGEITELSLRVFEPPRFFQGFLVGRKYEEVPEITSRICGICPVSHQLTAVAAIEDALGITPSYQTVRLRKLLALSQWIQSHTLHIYMLALPDFMGYESVMEMAHDHRETVEKALALKRLGNDLTAAVGGREVHPVTVVPAGFTRLPDPDLLSDLRERLEEAREFAADTVRLGAGISYPEFERPCEHVALRAEDEYAVLTGRLVSSHGLDVAPWEYRNHIREEHVPYSNSLYSYIRGRGTFMVGPLARVNLNFDQLSDAAREAARESGINFPSQNPYHNLVARAVELLHAIDECIEIIDGYEPFTQDRRYQVRAGKGYAITEAPRGTLYHAYAINEDGIVEEADIVTPTAHNVANMEQDLREFVPRVLDLDPEEATLQCETVIRNYDPCFSCSAHFLKFNVRRQDPEGRGPGAK